MRLSYAALRCLSHYSFLKGASSPQDLILQARALGYHAIALTDECSVSGVVRAHAAAREAGIKLIVGAEFALADAHGIERLILLAQSREGYGNLCELITLARRAAAKGSYRLRPCDLALPLDECLAIVLPLRDRGATAAAEDTSLVMQVAGRFPGRCWLGLELGYGPDDRAHLDRLTSLAARTQLPLIACEQVLFATREAKPLHDVLTAIRLKTTVAELGLDALSHAEHCMKPVSQLVRRYPSDALTQTFVVAARCRFSLDELRYEYPREVVPEGETPASYLRKLAYAGADRRFPGGPTAEARTQIEHELALIAELRYEPYFLTIYDVVREARERKILCQGRGSAANSIVCYCLFITEVGPDRTRLLFERFISRERNEPPDIDVDFEHERREEMMQYLFDKYGRERTALTAAVSMYRTKGALRDVGKAMGLTLSQVDQLAKSHAWWDGRRIAPERLRDAGFDPDNPHLQLILALVSELRLFPRHLSQHCGGFVIARDKLTRLVPIENAAMPDRTVIQWDKDDLDALGLLKVDLLSLGMLTAIRKTLDLIGGWRGRALALQDIPEGDAATYAMIQKADTVGVFQIESRAQMSMLPRLKPANFYDLVIEVAIVRPGPIQGGMVHPYLKRRNGEEPVTYPSPAIQSVLERTLGIPIFQEQVMQIAIVAAGFTPGQADQLRRAMAAWKHKGDLSRFRGALIEGMLSRGYPMEFAERIFEQMKGFGEYGFPESHAASFALLVYVSCWLKCHHPAAFTCGLLNAQPLGFYSPYQLVQDVRRAGVTVRPADVAVSGVDSRLEAGTDPGSPAIRLGLHMIKGLSTDAAQRIVAARTDQAFEDPADLKRRAGLTSGEVAALAAADALRTLAGHRRQALWEALASDADAKLFQAPRDGAQGVLKVPVEAENVFEDFRTMGLTLRSHPMALLRAQMRKLRMRSAAEVRDARPGQLIRAAGLVTCRQHPETAKGTTFVTLEDETGYVNVVVWARLAERARRELLFSRLMGVAGKIEKQGEVVHLIAGRLYDHSALLGELAVSSRDFH
ncbi:MAG: error-prone DNA polymerase [Betaproteobacteria bacterium]|nr:error-prone DNA polymerase [Betaproteobacteria bacterium]